MTHFWRLYLMAFALSFSSFGLELKSGDIILLPLSCRSCDVIASETDGSFSHSGVYVRFQGQDYILEALSSVRIVSLNSFIKRVPKTKKASVVRVKEFRDLNETELNSDLLNLYFDQFHGLGFDYKYLWNNTDEQGRELLYCSEFVAKLLNPFLDNRFETSPMDFSRNYEYWYRAFNGEVPQGLPGNSPNDLYRSDLVKVLGEL